jgi:hypothetical protein
MQSYRHSDKEGKNADDGGNKIDKAFKNLQKKKDAYNRFKDSFKAHLDRKSEK